MFFVCKEYVSNKPINVPALNLFESHHTVYINNNLNWNYETIYNEK